MAEIECVISRSAENGNSAVKYLYSIVISFAAALMPEPSMAQWQEHVFADLGVAMEFPVAPAVEDGEYQTVVIGDIPAPAVILSADDGSVSFKATVADLRTPEIAIHSANIMAECYFIAELEGRALSNLAFRAEDGTDYGVHGRVVDIEIEEEGRTQTACFVTNGRLYKLEATTAENAPQEHLAVATRFVRSLRFDVVQGAQ